jgi:hypothetical protein
MSVLSGPRPKTGAILEPPGPPASAPVGGGGSARVIGVDVARGLALLGMIAVHIFDTLHRDDTPSKTQQVMAGHALATFVLLAGVSLTFITKRTRRASSGTGQDGSDATSCSAIFLPSAGCGWR